MCVILYIYIYFLDIRKRMGYWGSGDHNALIEGLKVLIKLL
jgi:hypothetical protein